jgi:hypothetical protein
MNTPSLSLTSRPAFSNLERTVVKVCHPSRRNAIVDMVCWKYRNTRFLEQHSSSIINTRMEGPRNALEQYSRDLRKMRNNHYVATWYSNAMHRNPLIDAPAWCQPIKAERLTEEGQNAQPGPRTMFVIPPCRTNVSDTSSQTESAAMAAHGLSRGASRLSPVWPFALLMRMHHFAQCLPPQSGTPHQKKIIWRQTKVNAARPNLLGHYRTCCYKHRRTTQNMTY